MVSLVAATGFVGYLLVYAAVAHGGRYSARPWDALFETSTLGGGAGASTGGGGGGGGHRSILGRIISLGGKISEFVPLVGLP